MKIPNADCAVVDIRKLRDYCLNSLHDEGKHKARLFESVLGITADDAEQLRNIILQIVKTHEAKLGRRDEYGQRYTVDFLLEWKGKQAKIRSGWIIEHNSNIPRMTSCYPL
ncbi:MAG: putative adhesin/hemolysin precursor [Candidatus Jettenia ecosi]|uniref:Putative adhesin/hemolysin n=1 Tax=Candidatus Jettenia ecosi TaxID=2494326 RepID=A0A533QBH6_9BACT|nr:MAG: putative adhesin/hemolysin precursor [Candidatus Jettenia ecosi]